MFRLYIDTDNDSCKPNHYAEVAKLLRDVARRVEDGQNSGKILDTNGNTVGTFNASKK